MIDGTGGGGVAGSTPVGGGPAGDDPGGSGPVGHAAEQPGPAGRFGGLVVPDPGFADDDGSADPAVRAALAAWADGSGSVRTAVAALSRSRLLVPVVAVIDSVEQAATALPGEKDSHMATVSLVGADGRRGLLAFTGLDTLAAWNADARPVPAPAVLAARAAVDDGCAAMLLDVAGPAPRVLEGAALDGLAAGGSWPPVHEDPAVVAAVAAAALPVPGVTRVRLDPVDTAPAGPGRGAGPVAGDAAHDAGAVVVVIDVAPGSPAAEVARQVADLLAGNTVLAERLVRDVRIAVL